MGRKILLIFHYFHPDLVISARIFSDLAMDLAAAGEDVTVYCADRLHRNGESAGTEFETWNNVKIHRFPMPKSPKDSNFHRLKDSFILQRKMMKQYKRESFDAVILGSHPYFGYNMLPAMKRLSPGTKLFYWCFDLYPDTIFSGRKFERTALTLFKPWVRHALGAADLIADLGCCMKERLCHYLPESKYCTLTPWSLVEPESYPDCFSDVRKELFGNAKIGILYSGSITYGRDISGFIRLARLCRQKSLDVAFCFAGGGHLFEQQTREITAADSNIKVFGFVDEVKLEQRLVSADMHMLSLTEGMTGNAVPSKFFASIATGKPLLYSASDRCVIHQWCQQYRIGIRTDDEALQKSMEEIALMLEHPEKMKEMQKRAFDVYKQYFSRKTVVNRWLELLSGSCEK